MKSNNIAIVILTWNGLKYTRRCLESIDLLSLTRWVEVIVVDNGSTDGTVEYLRKINSIRLIENKQNLGYSRAVNMGIQAAQPDADIVLLNNDVELIESDWLDHLSKVAFTKDDLGIVGVKIVQDDGSLQHCGAYLPLDTCWGQQLAGGEVDIGQYAGIFECESVVFACVYIKRSVINTIGLLSEDYFAYFEDTDYCLRAKRSGITVAMCGDIRVKHTESSSTKENGVSHGDIFLKSQQTFKNKWGTVLADERYTLSLDWHSIINFPSGYAASSRSFVESLDSQGVALAYKYVYGPGTVFPVDEPEHSDSYIVNMVRSRAFSTSSIQVVYAQGDVFERNTGKYKIGYTMLEVDGLPPEWVRQANLMNEVWVPSHFNEKTFRDSGVTVPINVIPLGVDPAYFSPGIRGRKVDEDFTFLSIFEWGERKAPDILLRAFSDEFSRTEPVSLLCKANNFDPSVSIRGEISKLGLRKNGGRIFVAENQILQRYELGVLYRSADCFVLPTRGEGWGMPILEAMACGLPVIATNWSSQVDFMNTSNSLPLDVEALVPAVAKCPYYEGYRWAQPSYEHLRTLMRWVFEHRDEARAIGQRAAKDAVNLWSWSSATQRMIDIISTRTR
jgi:GT2 family glycosyltransferase/glycosyltransferase involved in cell wall biosynthesis